MSRIKNLSTLALSAGLAAGFSVAGASQNPLATIERIDGTAMVSEGARYVEAREGTQLRLSDRLLVLEGSSATIHFADGCERTMSDSTLLTIGSMSPCADEAAASAVDESQDLRLPSDATASASEYAAVEQGATSQAVAGAGLGIGTTAAVTAGAVAAVAAVAVVVENTNSDSDDGGGDPPLATPSP